MRAKMLHKLSDRFKHQVYFQIFRGATDENRALNVLFELISNFNATLPVSVKRTFIYYIIIITHHVSQGDVFAVSFPSM